MNISVIINDIMKKMMGENTETMLEENNSKVRRAVSAAIHYINGHREPVLQCVLALVLFILYLYRLSEIGQPILFNDEVGYWSNSAFFMGMDWTSVTGRIGYYSYGYSLLLVIIRMLALQFGWGWAESYHAAVVMNAGLLVISYALALRLSKRYLPEMNRYVRTVACFAVFTYSSFIVYAHITWTECTLTFCFWIFLYVMSRVIDRPGIGSHVAYAVVSFYMFTVHQRSLGIVITSMIIVLYMRLLRRNRVRDAAAYLVSLYLCSLIHAMIKGNLQNVNYLGGEPADLGGLLGYAFNGRALIILMAGIVLMIFLWLHDRRHTKTIIALAAAGIAVAAGYLYYRGLGPQPAADTAADTVANRLSTNDFSGQWGVVKRLFSRDGMIRLGVSMAGKLFYMAAASGLVVCWGIYGLFKNALILFLEHVRQLIAALRGKRHRETGVDEIKGEAESGEAADETAGGAAHGAWEDRIWLLGVLLAWFGTFMISAIYKEGLYKNDDLFNGRYVEFTIGFLLLYSFNFLLIDKKWLRKVIVYVVLYIGAGYLCQYMVDGLQRTQFELAHCVMFGRVFWNYEVPYGKVKAISRYIFPLGAAFLVVSKPLRERFSKAAAVRAVLALMIPIVAWSYLGKRIVDVYVVVRNEKQAEPFVQFANWIRLLGSDENVYYISDYANPHAAGALQYMLADVPVTVTWLSEVSFTEDAFYVVRYQCEEEPVIVENCEIVLRLGGYRLFINKNQRLMERWEPFMQMYRDWDW